MTREPLRIRLENGIAVVGFPDPNLDSESLIDTIGAKLYALIDEGVAKLVIDFSGVHYVASSMLGKLIALHRRATNAGGQVVLCGFSPYVRTIFEISCLNRIFPIHEDEAHALASLRLTAAGSGA